MLQTNAVFATCTGIASTDNGRFAEACYDYVIIDEAAKCNMLDLLIPSTMGKKLILVGDHKQLYPMLETECIKDELTEEQIKELREHILFKWMYEENIPEKFKIMLNRQYRMEKNISEFVSSRFYDGKLICEKDKENQSSMVWVDCEESEEVNKGTSYQNPNEAQVIVKLLSRLDETYKKGTAVGIICTYKAQAEYIKSLIKDKVWNNIDIECSTVDAFQGKEKHTIIFNVVRSKAITNFIKDENRINVAVSRAQEYLYVVGSAALVKNGKSGVLRDLYEYIRNHGDLQNSRYVR
jgi:superfamily I DNA and/or RNA helicase